MQNLLSDIRYAARLLIRTPGFTFAAVLTLALGIGANAAFFSLADATLLRPIDVADADKLAVVVSSSAYLDYQEYAQRRELFSGAFATGGGDRTRINLIVDGASHLASCTFTTGNMFELLGVPPGAGRVLLPSDDEGPGAPIAAVLSFEFWSARFGSDPSLIGKAVNINGAPATIVGVARKGFRGTNLSSNPQIWVPVTAVTQILRTGFFATENPLRNRGFSWLSIVGRLRDDVTLAQAADGMSRLYDRLHPPTAGRRRQPFRLVPLSARAFDRDDTGPIRTFVLLLVGTVGLTLLIGCANLANLLLARAAVRRREIGVRFALGATRRRVVAQLLAESMVLAGLGGAAGLVVAHLTLRLLSSYQLPGGIDIANLGLALDATTIGAAATLAVLTAFLFGLAPAWAGSRGDLIQSLRGAGDGSPGSAGGPRSARLRSTLVAAQVALSVVLLAGTGVFLRSLVNALETPLGFIPDRVATASVNLGLARYSAARAADFYSTALESVQKIPGVAVAAWGSLIPTNGSMMASVQVDGYAPAAGEEPRVLLSQVGPGYFRAVEARVLTGRAFAATDDASAPRVAIVNEAAARTYWPGREAVGGRVKMDEGNWVTVVGVAENSTISELGEEPFPFVYFPFDQDVGFGNLLGPAHLFVRTSQEPAEILPAIRDRLRALDSRVPVFDLQPLSFHIKELVMPQQMGAALLSFFSLLALCLATVGIYGVASYVAGFRTREVGIRIALGADRGRIGRLLLLDGLAPIATGIAIGIGMAMWAARFATAFVYQISPWDPATLVAVTILLAGLGLLASYLPARRAARLDPMVALRQD